MQQQIFKLHQQALSDRIVELEFEKEQLTSDLKAENSELEVMLAHVRLDNQQYTEELKKLQLRNAELEREAALFRDAGTQAAVDPATGEPVAFDTSLVLTRTVHESNSQTWTMCSLRVWGAPCRCLKKHARGWK